MCDSVTLKVIEEVVADNMNHGVMFTAHDVTRQVRDKVGRGVNVRHNEVKQEVHNLFVNGQLAGYTRTLGNFPVLAVQPFVYHRVGDDSSTYGVKTVGPVTATHVVVDDEEEDQDDGVNKTQDGTYKVDSRETLCVPKSLLVGASLNAGDTAHVSADALAGCVVVGKDAPDTSVLTPLSTYTVDKYGNVRITQFALQRGGVGGKEFAIDGDNKQVYVKKVQQAALVN